MPSVLPGYESDIFISYRQNDNQDGWVTRFVEALDKELKATLKNEVSIYFDENPHDGLLETHQVDASLAKKLKCLVFIPIVSQTYCDESSFAWEHEFMPFINMAKDDELGMNITLSNGNVVSRVLPVKIHNLDNEDQHTLEAVLDGPLRSIDFIYSSAGVNRPLRINEDDPSANLNKTYYRDQINKVANALKDIGNSILSNNNVKGEESQKKEGVDSRSSYTAPAKANNKSKLLLPLAFVVIMALAYFLVKPLIFKEAEVKNISEVGLAIMPLMNISASPEIGFLSFALKDEIHEVLAQSKKFAFLSSGQATASYQDKEVTPQVIGDELGVDYVLSGSYQMSGDQLNVRVEFSDAQAGKSVWTKKFLVKYEEANIFPMQAEIARKVLEIFNIRDEKLLAEKSGLNFESYGHYVKGLEWLQKGRSSNRLKAVDEFEQAVSLDSTHTQSWIALIRTKSRLIFNNYVEREEFESEIKSHIDYLSKDHPQWAAELAQGIYQYHVLGNYEEGWKHFTKVVEQQPENEDANFGLFALSWRKTKYRQAYNIMLKLISSDPKNTMYWRDLALVFTLNGDYKRSLKAYNRGLELGLDSTHYSGLPSRYWEASIPLDSIPAKHRASNTRFLLESIYSINEPRTIIEELKNVPLDEIPGPNYYTKTAHYSNLAQAYYALTLDDSASYYAKLCITENEQREEEEWRWYWVARAYSILGEQEKSKSILKQYFLSDSENLTGQVAWERRIIENLVLSKEYAEATKRLIELNRDFPEFGKYIKLTQGFYYDRAKKEYPPFAEAVANLKLPPPLVEDDQLEKLKY